MKIKATQVQRPFKISQVADYFCKSKKSLLLQLQRDVEEIELAQEFYDDLACSSPVLSNLIN